MKTPILIFESLDVVIFPSSEKACSDLEIVDVKCGRFDAYDSDGFRLDLVVVKIEVKKSFLGIKWAKEEEVILLKEHEPQENCVDEVRERIINYLLANKHSRNEIEMASLQKLIQLAGSYMPWRLD
jgi:hypothetical protein